jgi:hypothetical protein
MLLDHGGWVEVPLPDTNQGRGPAQMTFRSALPTLMDIYIRREEAQVSGDALHRLFEEHDQLSEEIESLRAVRYAKQSVCPIPAQIANGTALSALSQRTT